MDLPELRWGVWQESFGMSWFWDIYWDAPGHKRDGDVVDGGMEDTKEEAERAAKIAFQTAKENERCSS